MKNNLEYNKILEILKGKSYLSIKEILQAVEKTAEQQCTLKIISKSLSKLHREVLGLGLIPLT